MLDEKALGRLASWINERHAIYMRKAYLLETPGAKMSTKMAAAWEGESQVMHAPPEEWTLDKLTNNPILRQYRFCNVYRELDRVTVWIRENIREPFADHPHLWYMLAAARYINWPPTLEELIEDKHAWPDYPLFRPDLMTTALERRRARGEKVETGAYMIRAESDPKAPWYSWSKQRYVSEVVLGKLWEQRVGWKSMLDASKPLNQRNLKEVWDWFQDKHYTGWGPFMAYQVVVDLRWTRYLRDAPDIQTWAAVGPGSARGLNRLHGREVKKPVKQDQALGEMLALRDTFINRDLLAPWVALPDLSDFQNCLCEFDKYERVRLGEGRPRSQYVPGRGW